MKPLESLPERLLDVADHLAGWGAGRPSEAALRRAISSGYYAVFHLLLRACYKRLLANAQERAELGALSVRDVTHEALKLLAAGVAKPPAERPTVVKAFLGSGPIGPDLRSFCAAFVEAQQQREHADYDLSRRFQRSDVRTLLAKLRSAFGAWDRVPVAERDRFVVMLLLRARKRTA